MLKYINEYKQAVKVRRQESTRQLCIVHATYTWRTDPCMSSCFDIWRLQTSTGQTIAEKGEDLIVENVSVQFFVLLNKRDGACMDWQCKICTQSPISNHDAMRRRLRIHVSMERSTST